MLRRVIPSSASASACGNSSNRWATGALLLTGGTGSSTASSRRSLFTGTSVPRGILLNKAIDFAAVASESTDAMVRAKKEDKSLRPNVSYDPTAGVAYAAEKPTVVPVVFRKAEIIATLEKMLYLDEGNLKVPFTRLTQSQLIEEFEKFEATQLRLQYSFYRDSGQETGTASDWRLLFRLCFKHHQSQVALRLYALMVSHNAKPYSPNRRPLETEEERREEITPYFIRQCRDYVLLTLPPLDCLRHFLLWYGEKLDEGKLETLSTGEELLPFFEGTVKNAPYSTIALPGSNAWGAVFRALYALGHHSEAVDAVFTVGQRLRSPGLFQSIKKAVTTDVTTKPNVAATKSSESSSGDAKKKIISPVNENFFVPVLEQCAANGDNTNVTRIVFMLYQFELKPKGLPATILQASLKERPPGFLVGGSVLDEAEATRRVHAAVELIKPLCEEADGPEQRKLATVLSERCATLCERAPSGVGVTTAAIIKGIYALSESETSPPCDCFTSLMRCYLAARNPVRALEVYNASLKDISVMDFTPLLFELAQKTCMMLRDGERANQVRVERERALKRIELRQSAGDTTHELSKHNPRAVAYHVLSVILSSDRCDGPTSQIHRFYIAETAQAALDIFASYAEEAESENFGEAVLSHIATILSDHQFSLPATAVKVTQLFVAQVVHGDFRQHNRYLQELTPLTIRRLVDGTICHRQEALSTLQMKEDHRITSMFSDHCLAAVACPLKEHESEEAFQVWGQYVRSKTLVKGAEAVSLLQDAEVIMVTPSALPPPPRETLTDDIMELTLALQHNDSTTTSSSSDIVLVDSEGSERKLDTRVVFVVPWRSLRQLGSASIYELIKFEMFPFGVPADPQGVLEERAGLLLGSSTAAAPVLPGPSTELALEEGGGVLIQQEEEPPSALRIDLQSTEQPQGNGTPFVSILLLPPRVEPRRYTSTKKRAPVGVASGDRDTSLLREEIILSPLETDWNHLLEVSAVQNESRTGKGISLIEVAARRCRVWTVDSEEQEGIVKLNTERASRQTDIDKYASAYASQMGGCGIVPPIESVDIRKLRASKALQSMKAAHVLDSASRSSLFTDRDGGEEDKIHSSTETAAPRGDDDPNVHSGSSSPSKKPELPRSLGWGSRKGGSSSPSSLKNLLKRAKDISSAGSDPGGSSNSRDDGSD